MRMNLNDYVRVRLTDVGRAIVASKPYHSKYIETNAEGWTTFQLWDLMAVFGEHCYNGCQIPFETEIFIPNESLLDD